MWITIEIGHHGVCAIYSEATVIIVKPLATLPGLGTYSVRSINIVRARPCGLTLRIQHAPMEQFIGFAALSQTTCWVHPLLQCKAGLLTFDNECVALSFAD